jgi:type I restriction enzyme, S subunit
LNFQVANDFPSAIPINPGKWKHYRDYKDSAVEWLREIPGHWEIRKLKHVTICLDGRRVPLNAEERARIQGEYPYWGANGVLDHVDQWLFDEEIVLLGEDGAPFFEPNEDVAFFVQGKIWVNNHAHVLRADNIRPRFLTYCLNTVDYRAFIDGSTRDKLTQGDMDEISIQVPSDSEQIIIETFLDRETAKIDALVAKKERLIELLLEKRGAIITRAVTKGLPSTGSGQATPNVPMKDSGVEWLGAIPAQWERKPAKAVCQRIIDCKNRTPEYNKDGDFPVVRTTDVKDGKLSLAQCLRTDEKNFRAWTLRGAPQRNDILFTREAPAGEAALYDGTEPICLGQRMMYFRVNPEVLVSRFLLYSIYGALVKGYILAGSGGSTVTHLRLGQVYNLPLLIPPVTEQSAIVAYLDGHTTTIDRMVAKVREGIERLQEYRTALITAAVTGKIDVREQMSRTV